jgi:hypothetical protein
MRCELPNAKVDPTTGGDRLHTASTLDAKDSDRARYVFVCLFWRDVLQVCANEVLLVQSGEPNRLT